MHGCEYSCRTPRFCIEHYSLFNTPNYCKLDCDFYVNITAFYSTSGLWFKSVYFHSVVSQLSNYVYNEISI